RGLPHTISGGLVARTDIANSRCIPFLTGYGRCSEWTPRQTCRNIPPSKPRTWRGRAGHPLLSRRYITIIVVDNAEPYACPRKVARGEVEVRAGTVRALDSWVLTHRSR